MCEAKFEGLGVELQAEWYLELVGLLREVSHLCHALQVAVAGHLDELGVSHAIQTLLHFLSVGVLRIGSKIDDDSALLVVNETVASARVSASNFSEERYDARLFGSEIGDVARVVLADRADTGDDAIRDSHLI